MNGPRRVTARLFGCFFSFVVIATLAVIFPKLFEDRRPWPYKADNYQITYGCSGGSVWQKDWFTVTYIDGAQRTQTVEGSILFTDTYTMHPGDQAQITARASFDLHCSISIDGQLWRTCSNSGQDAIAECSGIVGRK